MKPFTPDFPVLRPMVAVASDRIERHGHPSHAATHGYLRAVAKAAQAMPLVLPALGDALDADTLIASIDGILLTGSPSNVDPARYGAPKPHAPMLLDRDRDAAILPLLPRLIDAGVPVLGICRGFQELNVVFGGTLNPAVHELPGALDHREGDHGRPIERWYDDSHALHIVPGTRLATLAGGTHALVNSLHHQGIERLGQGLRVEARAPDGLVEAFSIEAAPQFTLAVQWHPEMRIDDSPFAHAIFAAFGEACRTRQQQRLGAMATA
ncbi:gamma-glutamyl-gamma-aminobutyrate hydrolase family protein [Variovorax sp. dw_954]|uniref:gamma-glutamyl-gamma-aminobutyrate hydrolase family protein n=1 Tax=Variovorax sp. dw_954 TaxID=2720078 RepID=UPI001BD482C1|nr:gamma-glutamyl-gamma-aminobutyrate hydrolase family protein [Variovorax sp. dw_954]